MRPESEDGLLLFNEDTGEAGGDFLSLAMSDGYVELVMEDGSGEVRCRGEQRLELGLWHTVRVLREGGEVSLTVDAQTPVRVSQATGQTLSLASDLWLGGGTDSRGFKGCIKDLVINSLPVQLVASAVVTANLDSCHTETSSHQPLSLHSLSPHHPVPAFSGQSYLAFNSSDVYTK